MSEQSIPCQTVATAASGTSPAAAGSQVYRVAQRFVEQGLAGMADSREDNGDHKISEAYEVELLSILTGSPRDYGYLRTTWTQELLARVMAKRTGISVSTTTICRLLKRHRLRLGRPKPIVGCPWRKARRLRRLPVEEFDCTSCRLTVQTTVVLSGSGKTCTTTSPQPLLPKHEATDDRGVRKPPQTQIVIPFENIF